MKEIKNHLMRGNSNQATSYGGGVIKSTCQYWPKTLYYHQCKNVAKLVGAMCHLSQINKVYNHFINTYTIFISLSTFHDIISNKYVNK